MSRTSEAYGQAMRGAPEESEWEEPSDRELFRVLMPYDPGPASSNPGRGRHWGDENRLRVAAHEIAATYWKLAGSDTAPGPVRVVWVVYRARQLDADNLLRGLKGVRDALFGRRRVEIKIGGRRCYLTEPGRITPDDTPDHIRGERVVQRIAPKWAGNAWTDVCVIDAREEQP